MLTSLDVRAGAGGVLHRGSAGAGPPITPRGPAYGMDSCLGSPGTSGRVAPGQMTDGSTTHLSVIDRAGMAVSCTQTLLSLWGSRVTTPGTGVLLNNGMMWFDPEPGRPNSIGRAARDRWRT